MWVAACWCNNNQGTLAIITKCKGIRFLMYVQLNFDKMTFMAVKLPFAAGLACALQLVAPMNRFQKQQTKTMNVMKFSFRINRGHFVVAAFVLFVCLFVFLTSICTKLLKKRRSISRVRFPYLVHLPSMSIMIIRVTEIERIIIYDEMR